MGVGIFIPGADFSARNLGKAVVAEDVPPLAVSITNAPDIALYSFQLEASVFPVFTNHKTLRWSIVEGEEYATINQSGLLIVSEDAVLERVKVRVSVEGYPAISSEKEIIVQGREIETREWLKSDGAAYILIPGGQWLGYTVEAKVTFTTANGYPFGSQYSNSFNYSRFGCYQQNSSNNVAVALGSAGYVSTGKVRVEDQPYTLRFNLSTGTNSANAQCHIETLGSEIWSRTGVTCYIDGDVSLFCYGSNQQGPGTPFSPGNKSANKLFYFKVWDDFGAPVLDLRPYENPNTGELGLIDMLTGNFYGNALSTGSFTISEN